MRWIVGVESVKLGVGVDQQICVLDPVNFVGFALPLQFDSSASIGRGTDELKVSDLAKAIRGQGKG